jgi:hypothetical protein
MDEKNRALYDSLVKDGLYTKSYEDFNKQFAGHERIMTLFSAMRNDGHYTKTADDFKNSYFLTPPSNQKQAEESPAKIKIRDTRTTDAVTGQPLKDTARFHAQTDVSHIQQVVSTARKHGIDPYTALALNLAETRFDPELKNNPFMMGNYNPYGDVIDESMKTLAEKLTLAKKLGKTKEEEQLQLWNGTGKVSGKGFVYGIDTDKTPIDMSKTPLYGKRVIDLRERVLKQNADIKKVVDEVMSTNPQLDYKYFK